jgi:hypothetical protein
MVQIGEAISIDFTSWLGRCLSQSACRGGAGRLHVYLRCVDLLVVRIPDRESLPRPAGKGSCLKQPRLTYIVARMLLGPLPPCRQFP